MKTAHRKRRRRSPIALAAVWHEHAGILRQRGAAVQADVLEGCALELERWLASLADEALTLAQATAASGYSQSQLRRLIRLGALKNVGADGHVLVRRADLPRKVGRQRLGPDLPASLLAFPTLGRNA